MREEIIAKGKIFELVHITQDDGRVFEVARRAPGVRIIIVDDAEQKILLTREFRHELGEWDYRLPGGKLFDTLDEYEAFRDSGKDIIEAARMKVVAEAKEEAGLSITNLSFVEKSTLGATVEWDLYVFETSNWQENATGQELEIGEMIEAETWVTFEEAKHMILAGNMQEGRVALVLMKWLDHKIPDAAKKAG